MHIFLPWFLPWSFHGPSMLDTQRGFQGSFSAKNDVDEFDPKQIAPTLAMKAAPSTEELLKAPSRFSLKPKVNENTQK